MAVREDYKKDPERGQRRHNSYVEPIGYYQYAPPEERTPRAEARMREWCAARGVDWDRLSDEEQERMIDQMLHE